MNTRSFRAALASVAAMLILVSCGSETTAPVSDLDQAVRRWQTSGITSYRVLQSPGCFCGPPREWTAFVQDGQVVDVKVEPVSGWDPAELHEQALARAWTVEQAFRRIHGLESGEVEAADFRVTYDPVLGFPTLTYVDHVAGIADDENYYTLQDLTPIRR